MYVALAPAAGSINLEGGWSKAWGAISGAVPGLSGLMTTAGVLLVAWGIFKYIWDKRRGGGGNSQGLFWTVIVGAALAGPSVIIPKLLKIADWVANAVISLFN